MSARIPTETKHDSGDPLAVKIASSKRRVVRMKTPEPLSADRQYVNPASARSAVTYDLFTWATKHNRPAKNERRRLKVTGTSIRQPGVLTASERAHNQLRLRQYFEFGAGSRLRARSGAFELNVHRNRVLFVILLSGLLLYSLAWLAS